MKFTDIKILDIEGNEINMEKHPIHKAIGNTIYAMAKTIELASIAKKIHSGEDVELKQEDKEQIKQIVNSQEFGFIPMVQRQVVEFIDKN